jgi:hypothetical protein
MYSTVPRCGLRLLALIAFYYRTRIDGVCLSSPGSIGYRQVLIRCSVLVHTIFVRSPLSPYPYHPLANGFPWPGNPSAAFPPAVVF